MKQFLVMSAVLTAWTSALWAQEAGPLVIQEARDVQLEELVWLKRPVVVFADSPNDPRFLDQMQMLENDAEALLDRDVVVIVDTAPRERSAIRQTLRPRGFNLVLIGKDGDVKLRKPTPWTGRELSRSIDKMPMRREEIRRSKGLGEAIKRP